MPFTWALVLKLKVKFTFNGAFNLAIAFSYSLSHCFILFFKTGTIIASVIKSNEKVMKK